MIVCPTLLSADQAISKVMTLDTRDTPGNRHSLGS